MSTISHKGVIVSINDQHIKVKIESLSACSTCRQQSLCSLSEKKEKIIDIENTNNSNYHVGQEVNIVTQSEMGMFAVFMAYILPLIIFLTTLFTFAAILSNELFGALIALGSVVLYYLLLKKFNYLIKKKINFRIA